MDPSPTLRSCTCEIKHSATSSCQTTTALTIHPPCSVKNVPGRRKRVVLGRGRQRRTHSSLSMVCDRYRWNAGQTRLLRAVGLDRRGDSQGRRYSHEHPSLSHIQPSLRTRWCTRRCSRTEEHRARRPARESALHSVSHIENGELYRSVYNAQAAYLNFQSLCNRRWCLQIRT